MSKILLINLITTLRIIGVILLYPIFLTFGSSAAAIICLLCYFTDFLDGLFARKLQASTYFGSLYDSVADKLLNIVSLIILYNITNLTIILIIFEVLIIVINLLRFLAKQNLKTQQIGRIKMLVMAICIILLFVLNEYDLIYNSLIFVLLFGITVLFEVLTFTSYTTNFIINKKNFSVKRKKIDLKGKWFDHDFYEKNKNKPLKKLL